MKVPKGTDPRKKNYNNSDVLNMPMIAERFGVQLNTVHAWRKRSIITDFPPPDMDMPGGRPLPLWYWKTIRKWAVTHRPKML